MKQLYLTLAAAAAIASSSFGAKAFTVDEIVGTYTATNMNFSDHSGAFAGSYVQGLQETTWDNMTISIVEGNRVKITNFIKKGVYNGHPSDEGVFDIEGDFDPETNTITFQPQNYEYLNTPGYPFMGKIRSTIAKYDGVIEVGGYPEGPSELEDYEFENFTATFDENKNLTVSPWAMYSTKTQRVTCIPSYTVGEEKVFGTYFTPAGQSGLDDIQVEEIEDENAPVEYFNLQGMKVENPGTGMFIRRQGKKVQKVIIR